MATTSSTSSPKEQSSKKGSSKGSSPNSSSSSSKHKIPKIALRGDGKDGEDGQDGKDGEDGVMGNNSISGTDGTDATFPEEGKDGDEITLTLTTIDTEDAVSIKKSVKVHAAKGNISTTNNDTTVLHDETYNLSTVPSVKWSSTGGDGGHGANGGRGGHGAPGIAGADAVPPDMPGTDGTNGGSGGKGGSCTGGATGGRGGKMTVRVKEKDMYLLMAVDPCKFQQNLLVGGQGGKSGTHGQGGSGGPGGKGGRSCQIMVEEGKKKNRVTIPGGEDGLDGAAGLTPTWDVNDAADGNPGEFLIELLDNDGDRWGFFPERYDLTFENIEMHGQFPLANPSEFEFGDIISIQNIKVKNSGQMILPPNQEIHFCLKNTGDPNINPLISRKDAFLPAGTRCSPGKYAVSQGGLQFFAGFPGQVEDEYDFDPLNQTAKFHIQAYQYGPINVVKGKERTSDFKREYKMFHSGDGSTVNLKFDATSAESPAISAPKEDGITVTLKYPIENNDGLRAARSLAPSEETVVNFSMENVGADDIGGFNLFDARGHRRLALRYFLLRSRKYDLPKDKVRFTRLPETDDTKPIDLVGKPKLLDVPTLGPGDTYDYKTKLRLGRDVPCYSRMMLIVDVFISTLPLPKGIEVDQENYDDHEDMPPMSLIQRRKLEITCEPLYETVEGSRVVLVTSYATTRVQYQMWTEHVFTDTLNVGYEVFSVSRYGSLDPEFKLENEKTLREAFHNKLVIVLTEKFRENFRDEESISPLELLPNGCMEQASGYDSTTRWLVVGSNEEINKELLEAHLVTEPEQNHEYADMESFKSHIRKLNEARATLGRERTFLSSRRHTVFVTLPPTDRKATQQLRKLAKQLAEWLRQNDPLNQYCIEYYDQDLETKKGSFRVRKQTYLAVHCGFNRTKNSVVCISGKYLAESKQIKSDGMLMSIAESMTHEMRVTMLADAIRNKMAPTVVTAFKFACVSALIRDCMNFLDGEMKLNDDLELSFPSIGSLLESVEILSLLRDCKTFRDMMEMAEDELSDLLARLELVANSKDLRPRFSLTVGGKKQVTLQAMTAIVERLRVQWKAVISPSRIEERKKALKEEVKGFLKEDSGSQMVNVRADRRWIQGLNYVHSTENDSVFGIANSSKRLMELDLETEHENYKIPAPSCRVYSSGEMAKLREKIAARRKKGKVIADSVRHKRQFCVVAPFEI